jgi:hypothetical protein
MYQTRLHSVNTVRINCSGLVIGPSRQNVTGERHSISIHYHVFKAEQVTPLGYNNTKYWERLPTFRRSVLSQILPRVADHNLNRVPKTSELII